MFVLLKGATKEQAFKIGNEIAEAVTATNPKPIKLKFEKVLLWSPLDYGNNALSGQCLCIIVLLMSSVALTCCQCGSEEVDILDLPVCALLDVCMCVFSLHSHILVSYCSMSAFCVCVCTYVCSQVYLPCVLQTKKRYVGYMYESLDQKEPVFDAKGIETVRRDGCPAVSKVTGSIPPPPPLSVCSAPITVMPDFHCSRLGLAHTCQSGKRSSTVCLDTEHQVPSADSRVHYYHCH